MQSKTQHTCLLVSHTLCPLDSVWVHEISDWGAGCVRILYVLTFCQCNVWDHSDPTPTWQVDRVVSPEGLLLLLLHEDLLKKGSDRGHTTQYTVNINNLTQIQSDIQSEFHVSDITLIHSDPQTISYHKEFIYQWCAITFHINILGGTMNKQYCFRYKIITIRSQDLW